MLRGEKMSILIDWLESLSHELNPSDQCLRKFSPFSTCTSCIDSCEEQAISFEKGFPVINNQSCNLCGRCVTVCPVLALEGQSPSRKVANNVFIWEDGPLPTVNELLFMYKNEIKTISTSNSNDKLKQMMEETNSLLVKMGFPPFEMSPHSETDNLQEAKLSRRDFFNKLSFESKKLAATTMTPAKWRFNHTQFKVAKMYPDWAFFSISLNKDKCTLCETCFRLCPENVFSIEGEQLKIIAGNCTGCSLCVDVCRYEGINISQNVFGAATESMTIHLRTCKNCDDPFYSWENEESCFICKSKEANSQLNYL
jgi:ferredoxin